MATPSVLVTGSSGFIGRHLVDHLHALGHRVTALDLVEPRRPLPDGVRFLQCDLRESALPRGSFEVIVHLAALAGVRPSIERAIDYELTNVLGTLRLLDHCRRTETRRFVLASSSSVYGPDTPLPAREHATPDPCSPYALTKLHAEQWGTLHARLHGLQFIALRFFSVWGPDQRPDLAVESFRRSLLNGTPATILGDGSQRRDLTHVDDVVRAIGSAVLLDHPGATTINVGTGRSHSVLEILEGVKSRLPAASNLTPSVVYQPGHPADVPETRASLEKSRNLLVWEPRIQFPDGPPLAPKKV